jgi:hypothetical protein
MELHLQSVVVTKVGKPQRTNMHSSTSPMDHMLVR